ncbi:hypothetical protein T484DRAFT_1846671 [Baffinella frigidus]|nr:hypothetical protein T484DRAFT_1846671 [Cryptophyta sp. CCMP2293]
MSKLTIIKELIEDGRRAEQRIEELIEDGRRAEQRDKLTAATVFYEKEVALIAARKAAEQRLVALAAATEAMQGEEAA